MNYISLLPCSSEDFSGFSVVLAVAGCSHRCEKCWAKSQGGWKHTSGQPFTEDTYQELLEMASKPYISNVCIQGGDIFFRKNREEGLQLLQKLHKDLPDKNIVVWTGYTLTEVQNDLLMSQSLLFINYLMDGKYQHNNPTTKPFRGSDNQMLYRLTNGTPELID